MCKGNHERAGADCGILSEPFSLQKYYRLSLKMHTGNVFLFSVFLYSGKGAELFCGAGMEPDAFLLSHLPGTGKK